MASLRRAKADCFSGIVDSDGSSHVCVRADCQGRDVKVDPKVVVGGISSPLTL